MAHQPNPLLDHRQAALRHQKLLQELDKYQTKLRERCQSRQRIPGREPHFAISIRAAHGLQSGVKGADRLRLRLTASNRHASWDSDLAEVLMLYSARSLPCTFEYKTPTYCEATLLEGDAAAGHTRHMTWELPLRARTERAHLLGDESLEWTEILEIHFPEHSHSEHVDGMITVACEDEASEAQCAREFRRIPKQLRQTLEGFQEESIRFALRRHGRVLLADEMGLGKSLQALAIAAAYRGKEAANAKSFWPLLIVCPKSMRDVWVDMVERWLPFIAPDQICVVRRSMDMIMRRACTIVSYNMLTRLQAAFCLRHREAPFRCIILDEAHNARFYPPHRPSRGGQPPPAQEDGRRFDVLSELCGHLPATEQKLILLSGTPMAAGRLTTIYGQLRLLQPMAFGDYDAFGRRFCAYLKEPPPLHGKSQAPYWDGEHRATKDELHDYLSSLVMVRHLKAEVLQDTLVPLRRAVVAVNVESREVRRILSVLRSRYDKALEAMPRSQAMLRQTRYRFMQATGMAKLGARAEELKRFVSIKALQGVSHADADDDTFGAALGDDDAAPPTASEWLCSAIESQSSCIDQGGQGKMLIFAHHLAVLDALSALLEGLKRKCSVGYVRIDGSHTDAERTQLKARFESDASVRVAILSLTALSTGVTLNAASTVVFAELYHDWTELAQAEARCHRRGQSRQVSVFYLTARGTFDELLWPMLVSQRRRTGELVEQSDEIKDSAAGVGAAAMDDAHAGRTPTNIGHLPAAGHADVDDDAQEADASPAPRKRPRRQFTSAHTDEPLQPLSGEAAGPSNLMASTPMSVHKVPTSPLVLDLDSEAEASEQWLMDAGEDEAQLNAEEEHGAALIDATFDKYAQPDVAQQSISAWELSEREKDRLQRESPPRGRCAFWPSPFSSRVYLYEWGSAGDRVLDEDRDELSAGTISFLEASIMTAATMEMDDAHASPQERRTKDTFHSQINCFRLQWKGLTAIQRHSLCDWANKRGTPLILPLEEELEQMARAVSSIGVCYRRYAPRTLFTSANARTLEWRHSKDKEPRQWLVQNHPERPDEWLCAYCSSERDVHGGRCEPMAPFCSSGCADAWSLRVGYGNAIRVLLFGRDKGVCASCGLDGHALFLRLRPLSQERRREVLGEHEFARRITKTRLEGVISRCQEGDIWEADHIRAVVDGGGQADSLSQFQTLCTACHRRKTKADNATRKEK